MTLRTTIYCNDETEVMLNDLLDMATTNPAGWSYVTGEAAPTNFNQIIGALVSLGHRTLISQATEARVAESTPLWQAVDGLSARLAGDDDWAALPDDLAASLDYYLYGTSKEEG